MTNRKINHKEIEKLMWVAMTRAPIVPFPFGDTGSQVIDTPRVGFPTCPEEGLEGIWIDGENNPRRVEWNPDCQGLMVSYVKKESYIPGGYCYKIEQFKSLKWKLLEPAGKPPESDGKPETCNHWDPYDLG